MPRFQHRPLITAHDPEKLRVRVFLSKLPSRIDGIGKTRPVKFPRDQTETSLALNRTPDHLHPVARTRLPAVVFVRRLIRRNKRHMIQCPKLGGRPGNFKMSAVKRIKRSAKYPDTLGAESVRSRSIQKIERSTWMLSSGISGMSLDGSRRISAALNSIRRPPRSRLTLRRLAKSVNPPQAAIAPTAVKSLV